jgi:hypothetical protein
VGYCLQNGRLGLVGSVGPAEILVILVVALIVLGPERLPHVARQAGQLLGELRRVAAGFQEEMREAMEPKPGPRPVPYAPPPPGPPPTYDPPSYEPVPAPEAPQPPTEPPDLIH